jgi:uncharacterized protein (TIGR02757 family)
MKLTTSELKEFLDDKADYYNQNTFITSDPISIPHSFTIKEDIEIIGFLVAIIAWGNRKSIIKNGWKLVEIMENQPFEFIKNYKTETLKNSNFVHRTFNVDDLDFFFRAISNIYEKKGGMENAFNPTLGAKNKISEFRNIFLETKHMKRSEKHLANPLTGSSAKRINMYLRWMVRNDKKGVDFGIWNKHKMSDLYIPLDVHTGISARKLGLISRKANDWKSLEEMMNQLKTFCPEDPCKYDFALFGLSVDKVFED